MSIDKIFNGPPEGLVSAGNTVTFGADIANYVLYLGASHGMLPIPGMVVGHNTTMSVGSDQPNFLRYPVPVDGVYRVDVCMSLTSGSGTLPSITAQWWTGDNLDNISSATIIEATAESTIGDCVSGSFVLCASATEGNVPPITQGYISVSAQGTIGSLDYTVHARITFLGTVSALAI